MTKVCFRLREAYGCLTLLVFLIFSTGAVVAQTTSFTYQGRLNDGGTPANGNYDLQFALFDSLSVGNQIGTTQTISNLSVSNGAFTAQLDFGAAAFPGADRFLEISVRPAGSGSFTVLAPRRQLTSTPYAVRSLGATAADTADGLSGTCSNCVQDSNINSVAGSKVNGTIPVASVPGGSGNYIQNSTSQQTSSNFNVSGNGTAGGTLAADKVNAMTQYNIGGQRVLVSASTTNNTFLGVGAGAANPTGGGNSFFGVNAGQAATTGIINSFFGLGAGQDTTTGIENSFFGWLAGNSNSTHSGNSFFGGGAGEYSKGDQNSFFGAVSGAHTTGSQNAFFGYAAGWSNTSGLRNSFFGWNVGYSNTTGFGNSFFGDGAGYSSTGGSLNSFFGSNTGSSNTTGFNNSFFGAGAGYSNTAGNNNAFFGIQAGQANTTGGPNSFFGTNAGYSNTIGGANSFFGWGAGYSNTEGGSNSFFGDSAGANNTTGNSNTMIGKLANVGSSNLTNATAIGANAQVTQSNSVVLGSIAGTNFANADTKVGIGTSAPGYKLEVIDASNTGLRVQTNTTGGTVASFGSSGDVQVDAPAVVGGRFVVKEGGNVGIGTNAPLGKLQVVTANDNTAPTNIPAWDSRHFVIGADASSGGIGISYDQTNNVGYLEALSPSVLWRNLVLQSGGGNVGIGTSGPTHKLEVNGSVAGVGAYQIMSDARFKKNISPVTGALNKVLRLRGVSFDWRQEEFPALNFNQGRQVGFIAQEVETVLPEAVSKDGNGYYRMAYSEVTPVLVEAIKEQQAQIREQQDLVKQQQAQIEALQRENQALKQQTQSRLDRIERSVNALRSARRQRRDGGH